MDKWICEKCNTRNITLECRNPKCPTYILPKFPKIDTFPAIMDTFSTGIPEKVTREF